MMAREPPIYWPAGWQAITISWVCWTKYTHMIPIFSQCSRLPNGQRTITAKAAAARFSPLYIRRSGRMFSGWLTTITQFESLVKWTNILNPLLLGSMVILAWRASGSTMPALRFTLLGLLILMFTLIGIVPIVQSQPQIFVSFLIVLGVERHRSGGPFNGWGCHRTCRLDQTVSGGACIAVSGQRK